MNFTEFGIDNKKQTKQNKKGIEKNKHDYPMWISQLTNRL